MEQKFNKSGMAVDYTSIWKHLADKYSAETDNVAEIMNEKTVHQAINKYFSHLSETEKQSLQNELKAFEEKNGIQ